MKTPRILVLVVLCLGVVASTRADLVRLSFGHFDGLFIWRANDASVNWDHSPGDIYRLNIFYDTDTATRVSPDSGTFKLGDAAHNYWSMYFAGPEHATFKLGGPLETLDFSTTDDGLLGLRFDYQGDYGYFNFDAYFRGSLFTDSPPVPPLHFEESLISIAGGGGMFPYPNMGEGYGAGSFDVGSAVVAVNGVFPPVPEPATYGAAGAGVLMLALARRLSKVESRKSKVEGQRTGQRVRGSVC